MSASSKASHTVKSRYARALIDLAQTQGQGESLSRDIKGLQALLAQSADFQNFIALPTLGRQAQGEIIAGIAKKLNCAKLAANFLGVLAQNGRLAALPGILNEIEAELARRSGALNVTLESARTLPEATKAEIAGSIGKALDAVVHLDAQVRPEILGGVIVTLGSKMIDHSVKRKLENLKIQMKLSEKR